MYNIRNVTEDNIANVAFNRTEPKSFITDNKNFLQPKLSTKNLNDSHELKILFDSLFNSCKKSANWKFNIDLISHKNNKSDFLSSLSKLQQYLNSSNFKDQGDFLVCNEIFKDLCYYFLELLCEADLLSITKNYSNKIIATLKVIPDNAEFIYSYLVDLCSDYSDENSYTDDRFDQSLKLKFCNIYTILSSDLLNSLKRDDVPSLLNKIISKYLKYSLDDFDQKQHQNEEVNIAESFSETNRHQHSNLEGIKCINVLLYNKLLSNDEINKGLIDSLLKHLLDFLDQESTKYQRISSFSTCFIGIIPYIVEENATIKALKAITTDNADCSGLRREDEDLVNLVRKFPKLNYIYIIRSIVIFLHSKNYRPSDVFSGETHGILRNCYEIIRVNLMKNNHFIINYALLQTVQSYTIFLSHHDNDDNSTEVIDLDMAKNSGKEENRDSYIASLIELSRILVNYFNNKIKTISHLSIYIYKKLLQALSSSFSCTASEDTDGNKSQFDKKTILVENVMKNMKANVTIKNKYIILDTVTKLMSVEKLLEYEPYLLLHLMVNIANNKSTISSLLSQLLLQIQSVFKRFTIHCNIDNENLLPEINGIIQGKLDEIAFKCYLYPLLICIINNYSIPGNDSTDNPEYLMPTNTDSSQEGNDEYRRDRCDSINKVLMKIIPNYTFELLKIANESYRFDYFEYLPKKSKEILSNRIITLDNITTDLEKFYTQIVKNIGRRRMLGEIDSSVEDAELDKFMVDNNALGEDEEQKRMYKIEWKRMETMVKLEGELINDKIEDLLAGVKIVELYGKINYYESVCLHNFRRTNKVYFVNMTIEDSRYDGIIVSNSSEKKLTNKNLLLNEVYYIDIRRYMYSMYYAEDIEVILNLVKCISDCRKISKLISSNEFTLIKFTLKHVIMFINLPNQHYFTQLIQLFLQRLKYNYDDLCTTTNSTDDEGLMDNNDTMMMSKAAIKEYLIGNLKEIMEILLNNINVYNNENKIMISLNVTLYICGLFLEIKECKGLNQQWNAAESGQQSLLNRELIGDVLLGRVFNLFYSLKPCNHKILLRILRHVSIDEINGLMRSKEDELIRLLFNFNQNKYEIASNILELFMKNSSDDEISNLFIRARNYYNNHVSRKVMENTKTEGREESNSGKIIMLNTLFELILDYRSNMDEYLGRNITVSGLINLLNNVMEHMDEICGNKLAEMYMLLLKTLKQVINEYLSPKAGVGDDNADEGRLVDCRGYCINKPEKEDKYEWSNVIIRRRSCKCTLYGNKEDYDGAVGCGQSETSKTDNNSSNAEITDRMGNKDDSGHATGVGYTGGIYDVEKDCRLGRRYEMNNRNEFKLFNYLIYKMVHEFVSALHSLVNLFTNSTVCGIGWSRNVAAERLDELTKTMMYCIINCRHVGCNDMFNSLLLCSLQKMLEFQHNNRFLYNYVYYLIDLIVSSQDSIKSSPECSDKKFGEDARLLSSNVIDIHTRSEHLSLIFISIIKSESNKKISDLNNQIIFILLYIVNEIEHQKTPKLPDINGIGKTCATIVANFNRGSEVVESTEDRSLIVINVLNILRYIYRCIDMKYMNNENVVEVIRVCLRHMRSSNWSVKNSSSLLLSTVLSSLNANQHLLSSGLLTSPWLFGELSAIMRNSTEEVAYYTLYVLQLVLNQSTVNLVELLRKTDLVESIKALLARENLYLRRLAASVLSSYYAQTESEIDEILKLEREMDDTSVCANYLSGYLMVIKNTVESTNAVKSESSTNALLETLGRMCKKINTVENYVLVREILNTVGSEDTGDGSFLKKRVYDCVNSCKLNKFHESELLELTSRDTAGIDLNALEGDCDNIYLITKYFELLVQRNEVDLSSLDKLYRLIVKYRQFIELYTYYFSIANKIVRTRVVDGGKSINDRLKLFDELYSGKYYELVKFCVSNELTSNNSLYTELFKSLYYYFIIVTGNEMTSGSFLSKSLLSTLGCMLANNSNNTSELEVNIRLEISSLYLDTFRLIRPSYSNCVDEEEKNLIRRNVLCIFCNMLTLLQDDKIHVRTNVMNIVRLHIVNSNRPSSSHDHSTEANDNQRTEANHDHVPSANMRGVNDDLYLDDGFYGLPEKVVLDDISYESRLLEYVVNAFDINDTISLFHYYLLIDLNTLGDLVNSKNLDEQIYEEEDNNMYREPMLIVKNMLRILVHYISQRRFIEQIHRFLTQVITAYQNCLNTILWEHDGEQYYSKQCTTDKLNGFGLKGTKYILTNTIILFLLLSLKFYLIKRCNYSDKHDHHLDVDRELLSNELNYFKLIHGIVVNQYPSEAMGKLYSNLCESLDVSKDRESVDGSTEELTQLMFKNTLISL
ncbi:hypothetical protein MACJ_000270 [Theileria orientalis]|uniref:DUF2428 domain-containing protein n=1 Tax=Theileria orientalis TaxID=68886 RepID=A0A976M501_THEOR|nr:hypothetical protein MACJ_000270 [Theileria orientalis]